MRKLGMLRGIAILAVVLSHSASYGEVALGWWGQRYGKGDIVPDWSWVNTPVYYSLMGLSQLALFSVPVFLFASAFYVFYAAKGKPTNLTLRVVRGWLGNLLPPFFVWMFLSSGLSFVASELSFPGEAWSLADFVVRRARDYYYVPLLAQFFVLSPAMVWLVYKNPKALLALSALLEVISSSLFYARYFGAAVPETLQIFYQWGELGFWRWGFFFALGLTIACYPERFRQKVTTLKFPLTIIAAILGILSVVEVNLLNSLDQQFTQLQYWKLSSFFYVTTVLLATLGWEWPKGQTVRFLEWLGARSYGIYLIQVIAIEYVAKMVYHIAPALLPQQVLFVPLLTLSGIGLPLLIMMAVRKTPARRYSRQLFG